MSKDYPSHLPQRRFSLGGPKEEEEEEEAGQGNDGWMTWTMSEKVEREGGE
jgi:hypothetical protein